VPPPYCSCGPLERVPGGSQTESKRARVAPATVKNDACCAAAFTRSTVASSDFRVVAAVVSASCRSRQITMANLLFWMKSGCLDWLRWSRPQRSTFNFVHTSAR